MSNAKTVYHRCHSCGYAGIIKTTEEGSSFECTMNPNHKYFVKKEDLVLGMYDNTEDQLLHAIPSQEKEGSPLTLPSNEEFLTLFDMEGRFELHTGFGAPYATLNLFCCSADNPKIFFVTAAHNEAKDYFPLVNTKEAKEKTLVMIKAALDMMENRIEAVNLCYLIHSVVLSNGVIDGRLCTEPTKTMKGVRSDIVSHKLVKNHLLPRVCHKCGDKKVPLLYMSNSMFYDHGSVYAVCPTCGASTMFINPSRVPLCIQNPLGNIAAQLLTYMPLRFSYNDLILDLLQNEKIKLKVVNVDTLMRYEAYMPSGASFYCGSTGTMALAGKKPTKEHLEELIKDKEGKMLQGLSEDIEFLLNARLIPSIEAELINLIMKHGTELEHVKKNDSAATDKCSNTSSEEYKAVTLPLLSKAIRSFTASEARWKEAGKELYKKFNRDELLDIIKSKHVSRFYELKNGMYKLVWEDNEETARSEYFYDLLHSEDGFLYEEFACYRNDDNPSEEMKSSCCVEIGAAKELPIEALFSLLNGSESHEDSVNSGEKYTAILFDTVKNEVAVVTTETMPAVKTMITEHCREHFPSMAEDDVFANMKETDFGYELTLNNENVNFIWRLFKY